MHRANYLLDQMNGNTVRENLEKRTHNIESNSHTSSLYQTRSILRAQRETICFPWAIAKRFAWKHNKTEESKQPNTVHNHTPVPVHEYSSVQRTAYTQKPGKLFDINFNYLHIYGIWLFMFNVPLFIRHTTPPPFTIYYAKRSTTYNLFIFIVLPNKMHNNQHNEQLV